MIKDADMTRKGFINGDIATVMNQRTVLHGDENTKKLIHTMNKKKYSIMKIIL